MDRSVKTDEPAGAVRASVESPTKFTVPPAHEGSAALMPQRGVANKKSAADKKGTAKPPRKTRKTKATTDSVRKAAPQTRKNAAPPKDPQSFDTDEPLLQPWRFAVYFWETPRPTDFLNLPESRKQWKAGIDADMEAADDSPELDDWHDFCGVISDLVPDLTLQQSVALNFVSRGKRAFRAGRSWKSFEEEELAIDSRAGARAIADPIERDIALSSSLDNDYRLYIFGQIKVRLCHEIWLQAYPWPGTTPEPEEPTKKRHSVINPGAVTPSSPSPPKVETSGSANSSSGLPPLPLTEGTQGRTKAELPGDRELHQPQSRRFRATQANMQGLNLSYEEQLEGIGLDMATSSEEE